MRKLDTHTKYLDPLIIECQHAFTFSSTVTYSGTVSFTGDINLGDTSADTLTVTGTSAFVSSIGVTFADDEALTITTADTTAGASAPLVMTTTLSGVGVTGGRALFHTKFGHACGAWVNALKGYLEITGTGGYTTGLASAVVAEMKFAAKATLSGSYYPLEIEVVCPATFSISGDGGSNAGFIYARVSGTTDNWEDEAWFVRAVDLTAATDNMLSANSQTLRCAFGTQGTPVERFMVFSQLQDALSLDGCATAITLGDSVTTVGVEIGNVPIGINLDGDFTDAIKIAGSNTIVDGIEIGICSTNAINIAVQTTTGIKFAGGGSYNPIHIGVKSNTASVGHVLVGVLDDMGGVMVFCDDGGVDLTNSWSTSPIWTRYVITANQTSNTATGAYLQLKTQGARTLTSCDYSAIKAYLEVNGTMGLTTADLATINVTLEYAGNITNTSGTLAGIKLDINDKGSYSITDTAVDSAAILIEKNSSSTLGWPVGVKINDAGAVTGIKIGTCTTAISLAGACATGITMTYTATAVNSRAIKTDVTILNAAHGDGYSANEFQLNLTGSSTGHVACAGAWVNAVSAGNIGAGGNFIQAQTNGVYQRTSTITGANIIYGMRMACDCTGTDAAGYYPFSIVHAGGTTSMTALFHCSAAAINLGATMIATENGTKIANIPVYKDGGGTIGYMRIYDSADIS